MLMLNPATLKRNVKESLQEIAADKEVQLLIWSGMPQWQSHFTDMICGLFDDSALGYALETGKAEPILGPELTHLLIHIGELADQIVELPEMEEMRQLARRALADPIFDGIAIEDLFAPYMPTQRP
jgi:hypothetical protein